MVSRERATWRDGVQRDKTPKAGREGTHQPEDLRRWLVDSAEYEAVARRRDLLKHCHCAHRAEAVEARGGLVQEDDVLRRIARGRAAASAVSKAGTHPAPVGLRVPPPAATACAEPTAALRGERPTRRRAAHRVGDELNADGRALLLAAREPLHVLVAHIRVSARAEPQRLQHLLDLCLLRRMALGARAAEVRGEAERLSRRGEWQQRILRQARAERTGSGVGDERARMASMPARKRATSCGEEGRAQASAQPHRKRRSVTCCMTYATSERKEEGSISDPSTRTRPPIFFLRSEATRPARMLSSDVLPAPAGRTVQDEVMHSSGTREKLRMDVIGMGHLQNVRAGASR